MWVCEISTCLTAACLSGEPWMPRLPASMARVSLNRYEMRYWLGSSPSESIDDGTSITLTCGIPPDEVETKGKGRPPGRQQPGAESGRRPAARGPARRLDTS